MIRNKHVIRKLFRLSKAKVMITMTMIVKLNSNFLLVFSGPYTRPKLRTGEH